MQNLVIVITFRPSCLIRHQNCIVNTKGNIWHQLFMKVCQNIHLGQFRNWFMSDQKLGHKVKLREFLVNTLKGLFLTRTCWNLFTIIVLMISILSWNINHVRQKLGHKAIFKKILLTLYNHLWIISVRS